MAGSVMLLLLDVGNTRIGFGLSEGEGLAHRWSLPTALDRSAEAYARDLKQALEGRSICPDDIEAVVSSSVVQGMIDRLRTAVHGVCTAPFVAADPSMDLGVAVAVPVPEAVGIDRLLAAGEAYHLLKESVIVVDFGSAVTIDLVSADGRFLGGAITAGLRTTISGLSAKTSLLPDVDLAEPESVLGQDTRECILAGVVHATAGGVDRVILEIVKEVDTDPQVCLTGGDAAFLSPFLQHPHRIEPDLVLRGLATSYKRTVGSVG